MNENQGRGIGATIVAFLAAVYSVLLFSLKSNFTVAQWVAYGYTMLAFLLLFLDVLLPFSGPKKYPMFDLPISLMTCVYFVVQLILGGIVAMRIPGLSLTTAILVGLIVIAIYIMATLALMAGGSHVQIQDEQDVKNISAMRKIKADLDTISAMEHDTAVKRSLKRLSEMIAYSDPVSSSALEQVETRLKNNIVLLREDVEDGDADRITKRIEKVELLIKERSHLCRALKK